MGSMAVNGNSLCVCVALIVKLLKFINFFFFMKNFSILRKNFIFHHHLNWKFSFERRKLCSLTLNNIKRKNERKGKALSSFQSPPTELFPQSTQFLFYSMKNFSNSSPRFCPCVDFFILKSNMDPLLSCPSLPTLLHLSASSSNSNNQPSPTKTGLSVASSIDW